MKLISIFILLSGILHSCSFFSSNESNIYVKSKFYQNDILKIADKSWEQIKTSGADFAIFNKKTSSIFLINSACRKNEASSLNALSSALLSGIEEIETISKEVKQYFDREAHELRLTGKVDGIKTYINILTTQKNYCIYDFVLIAKNQKKLDLDYKYFNLFINKVKIE
jgi:hypothetical protein